MSTLAGYRVEYRPGDPCFYKPEQYAQAREAGYRGDVWGLFTQPQPGSSPEVNVYLGWCWIQPRYAKGFDLTGFVPLYLGPQVESAPIDAVVALVFPSLVEPEAGKYDEARAVIAKLGERK